VSLPGSGTCLVVARWRGGKRQPSLEHTQLLDSTSTSPSHFPLPFLPIHYLIFLLSTFASTARVNHILSRLKSLHQGPATYVKKRSFLSQYTYIPRNRCFSSAGFLQGRRRCTVYVFLRCLAGQTRLYFQFKKAAPSVLMVRTCCHGSICCPSPFPSRRITREKGKQK
jgi:hypothetical protein